MDKAIVLAFSIVLLLVISMQFFLYSLPFFQRIDFDAVCHRALMRMDRDGGLTPDTKSLLVADLIARDYTGIDIHATSKATFGQDMLLNVHAHLKTRHLSSLLQMEIVNRIFTYENIILCRRIETTAPSP
ncbi:MAG: hypothetical protein H6Q62_355 [Firmicutes bacterium]|nr:hypothetical protein [Bacillota bacterium]